MILWACFAYRRTRTKIEVPPQTRYNMPLEALYTVVPVLIVSVFFFFTARDESKLLELSDEPAHTINVVGFQWSWAFNYVEDVDGDTATGDAKKDKDLKAIPDRFKDAFPEGAEASTPSVPPASATRRTATRARPCGSPRARRSASC